MKNIPIPTKDIFLRQLIGSVGSFVERIRWKIFHYEAKKALKYPSDFTSPGTRGKNALPVNSMQEQKRKEREAVKFYGLKTCKSAPHNDFLDKFEYDLLDLVRNIKFKETKRYINPEIRRINEISEQIKSQVDLLVPADKTKNFYKMSYQEYKKILIKELNKNYKITPKSTLDQINLEAKNLLTKMNIHKNTEIIVPREPRFTLKDHKQNVNNNASIRLICPSGSDLGKISKNILDRILPKIKEKVLSPLWNSSSQVIDWFSKLKHKNKIKFIAFDIDNYYQSITPDLLNKALCMARRKTDLTKIEIELILLARKTLIKFDNKYWTRKNTPNNFNILMGSTDSAQVTDLVGLFLLNEINFEIPSLLGGLYRDDALFSISTSKRGLEQVKKQLRTIFKNFALNITIDINTKVIHFLDVTLDLENNSYQPYHKPDLNLHYVHNKSNHPSSIINSIVPSISKRISRLSANREIFNNNTEFYNNALLNSGYNEKISYNINIDENPRKAFNIITHNMTNRKKTEIFYKNKNNNKDKKKENFNYASPQNLDRIRLINNKEQLTNTKTSNNQREKIKIKKKNRRRICTWFNPPFSLNVKTNIPKEFFKLIENNFKPGHKYSNIINKNTVRISYSTVPNLTQNIINSNHKKIIKYQEQNANTINNNTNNKGKISRDCSCNKKITCPLNNKCVRDNVVYKCTVKSEDNSSNNNNNSNIKIYIGSTSNNIKQRISSHNNSFKYNNKNNSTSLSKHIWSLKNKKIKFIINWKILKRTKAYIPGSKICGLCLEEALQIVKVNKASLLNIKSEIIPACLHKKGFRFDQYKVS